MSKDSGLKQMMLTEVFLWNSTLGCWPGPIVKNVARLILVEHTRGHGANVYITTQLYVTTKPVCTATTNGTPNTVV